MGAVTYAVNGTAKSLGYPPVDAVWRANPKGAAASINPVERVSEVERRRVFAAVASQDNAASSDEGCKRLIRP